MKLGYIRVSRGAEQSPAGGRYAAVRVDRNFTEKVPRASQHKPQQARLIEQQPKGDTVVVWDIDGTGRPAAGAYYPGADYAGGRLDWERHGIQERQPADD